MSAMARVEFKRAARRRSPIALPATASLDMGPDIRHERGELVRDERPDLDAPTKTISAARRKDGLRAMYDRGHIAGVQWAAAEKFRDDLAFADGAHPDGGENGGVRTAFDVHKSGPADAQIDAIGRVRGAWLAVGLLLSGVLCAVVVTGDTLDEWAATTGTPRRRAGDMLQAALDNLVAFYEGLE